MGLLPNELHVEEVLCNGYTLYKLMRGEECLHQQASKMSDDDVKRATMLYWQRKTTGEPTESERLKQLREKNYRHGQFPRGDDESARDG